MGESLEEIQEIHQSQIISTQIISPQICICIYGWLRLHATVLRECETVTICKRLSIAS